jgi:hypothetical protein
MSDRTLRGSRFALVRASRHPEKRRSMIHLASDEWALEDLVPAEDDAENPALWQDLTLASGLAVALLATAAFLLLS